MEALKMEVLHLTLKKKWFDMILSGEKKEEYREVKDYWMIRLAGIYGCGTSYNFHRLAFIDYKCRNYDAVIFKNGYSKNAPEMKLECKGITVGDGNDKWGAPNHRVFIIKLGKILETKNI